VVPYEESCRPSVEQSGSQEHGLEIRGLCKAFQGVPAVQDVDLTVDPGEFVTLLGPSGSGKTTTLNMVAGFLLPDGGEIKIGGRELSRVPPEHRGLGIVFQSYALFPHMTIGENVAFPLKQRKIRGTQLKERVHKALEAVELSHRVDSRPRELSGGQQQRAALARALVFEPPLILFDEPLGALDRRLRERLQIQLREMHESLRFTGLYVTHDQEEALRLSDRVAIMNEGRLVQVGGCEDIYDRPRNAFVAKFLGDANLLKVTVLERGLSNCKVKIHDSGVVISACHHEESGLESGCEALIVVRPEALSVTRVNGDHRLLLTRGCLSDRVFVGQDVVSVVETAAGNSISVRERPDGTLTQDAVGQEVCVSWRVEREVTVVPLEDFGE
jgi:putative spermidine/putrescine transport system ATP-binding protein